MTIAMSETDEDKNQIKKVGEAALTKSNSLRQSDWRTFNNLGSYLAEVDKLTLSAKALEAGLARCKDIPPQNEKWMRTSSEVDRTASLMDKYFNSVIPAPQRKGIRGNMFGEPGSQPTSDLSSEADSTGHLTPKDLHNCTYADLPSLQALQETRVTFSGTDMTKVGELVVSINATAFGELNGKPAAACELNLNSGGIYQNRSIAVIFKSQNKPECYGIYDMGSFIPGVGITISSLQIKDDRVIVERIDKDVPANRIETLYLKLDEFEKPRAQ